MATTGVEVGVGCGCCATTRPKPKKAENSFTFIGVIKRDIASAENYGKIGGTRLPKNGVVWRPGPIIMPLH